ncbi:putative F-box domain-containing protein [Lupinus albus]|uniref:Putative F-box domain-containing protein n=1 Tax=Lupinus albus TaxID=3870 RepID=A0A6A4NUX3_LUPAL|nr:putative F-box domain-containing protein [Lupinus albus]
MLTLLLIESLLHFFQKMKKVQRFLNTDVLFDVLTRIPVKALLGLKCISREWHHIISSRSFIRAQLENTELVLTGFILQEKFMWCNEDIKTVSYIPVGTTTTIRNAKMQHQRVFHFLPEDVVVLASCKGLVCCRSCFPCEEPTIYVCNPSNKQWIKLDWHGCEKNESIALAFDLDSSFDNFTKFKLVRVKPIVICEDEYEEMYLEFELYSSETGAWWKSNETCQCGNNLIKNKGIYIGGVLHWLTDGDQVLTFDVEKELSWLISVPVPAFEFESIPEACIGESEGKLHYILISDLGLHVWYLEDYYESKWTLKHYKSLEEIEGEYPNFFFNLKNRVLERVDVELSPWMNPLSFKDGILLMKVCADLFLYDIENNKIVQTCTLQDLNTKSMSCPTVLPHSLSLVPLTHAYKVPCY